ncbi:MAG: IS4 family transposase [Alphaproteobacteria bacterium]|nr:IS4 family transposase [Alphaproteobacteria bacterium]MCB9765126.1 IS4 family transposase [Alphaproteobacteria bacterium]
MIATSRRDIRPSFWRSEMQAAQVQELFEAVFPVEFIESEATRLGVQLRQRHLRVAELMVSLVLMGGSPEAGRISAAVRDYCNRGNPKVVRSASSKWFDEELLTLVTTLSARAREYVSGMPLHLPGILAGRRDWRAFDSTTVKLDKRLLEVWPGTGDYAALKVHKELSLGCENVVDYHISPAKEHDAPHLCIDEGRRGTGLIVDLGYVSHKLFRSCEAHDVHLVVRLKEGWKLRLDDSVTAGESIAWLADEDQIDLLAAGDCTLRDLPEKEMDIDVRFGPEDDPIHARLIVFEAKGGWGYLLTNVPRETHTGAEVAMLYRLRWSVELQNKLAKTGCQLDEITARTAVPAEILVHAAMIASILANAVAHLEHLDQGLVGETCRKMKSPPLHAMLVWKCITTATYNLATLLVAPEDTSMTWEQLAQFLRHGGQDPNWKGKPSAIDQVKGRTASGRAWKDLAGRRRRAVA